MGDDNQGIFSADLDALTARIAALGAAPARIGPARAYTERGQLYQTFAGGLQTTEGFPAGDLPSPAEQAKLLETTIRAELSGRGPARRVVWRTRPEIRTRLNGQPFIYCRLALEPIGEQEEASAPEPPILKFFEWEHLPPRLQDVSRPFATLAHWVVAALPDGPERTVALRKLLEAKDCAVRTLVS